MHIRIKTLKNLLEANYWNFYLNFDSELKMKSERVGFFTLFFCSSSLSVFELSSESSLFLSKQQQKQVCTVLFYLESLFLIDSLIVCDKVLNSPLSLLTSKVHSSSLESLSKAERIIVKNKDIKMY